MFCLRFFLGTSKNLYNCKKHVAIHNVFFLKALSLREQNASQLSAENYSHSGVVIWKKVGIKEKMDSIE